MQIVLVKGGDCLSRQPFQANDIASQGGMESFLHIRRLSSRRRNKLYKGAPNAAQGADVTDALMAICECAAGVAPMRVPAGTVLFRPQEPCRGFLALRSGSIKVSLTSASGREIVLYRVHPGEICLQTFAELQQRVAGV